MEHGMTGQQQESLTAYLAAWKQHIKQGLAQCPWKESVSNIAKGCLVNGYLIHRFIREPNAENEIQVRFILPAHEAFFEALIDREAVLPIHELMEMIARRPNHPGAFFVDEELAGPTAHEAAFSYGVAALMAYRRFKEKPGSQEKLLGAAELDRIAWENAGRACDAVEWESRQFAEMDEDDEIARDGPRAPDYFCWKNMRLPFNSELRFRLVRCVWDREWVEDDVIVEHVYGHDSDQKERALRKLRDDVNHLFHEWDVPFTIRRVRSKGYALHHLPE
jgi:hypothetical protein